MKVYFTFFVEKLKRKKQHLEKNETDSIGRYIEGIYTITKYFKINDVFSSSKQSSPVYNRNTQTDTNI